MELYLGDQLIWENPEDLGHFGIKLRKQVYEQRLADSFGERRKRGSMEATRGVFIEVRSTFSPNNVALWFGRTIEDLLCHLVMSEAEHLDLGSVRRLPLDEVEALGLGDYEFEAIARARNPKPWELPVKHIRTYAKPVETAVHV